jgi:curved DNA-binding protein CbpA
MNGQLQELPLIELIREIKETRLSGALRLTNDRIKEVIYFDSGEIILVSSNIRAHRLIECLQRWNLFSADSLIRFKEMPDKQAVETLLKENLVSSTEMEKLLIRQAYETISPALLWLTGEWEFAPRVKPAEETHINFNISDLLLEAAHRLPTDFIVSRFPNQDETLRPITTSPDNLKLSTEEAFIYSRIDAPISLRELALISGIAEKNLLRAIYGLALVGLLIRDNWPRSINSLSTERKLTGPLSAPKVQTGSLKPSEPVKAEPTQPAPRDEKTEIETLFSITSRDDYYQIFNLNKNAKPEEIKQSYHSLVKRFHPDRFHQTVEPALRTRIESAFSKITQAYETLKDEKLRAAYDLKISKPVSSTTTNSPAESSVTTVKINEAEKAFQNGLAALQQNNYALALKEFAQAAQLEPTQARYRAHYGRELMRDPKTRRTAETELLAAISIDQNNASYRVMLAELYRDIGLLKRAEGELTRALSIDPKHKGAKDLLKNLLLNSK